MLLYMQGHQSQGTVGVPQPEALASAAGKGPRPSSREGGQAEGVGEEDSQGAQGFYVGLAPANLRPPNGINTGSLHS